MYKLLRKDEETTKPHMQINKLIFFTFQESSNLARWPLPVKTKLFNAVQRTCNFFTTNLKRNTSRIRRSTHPELSLLLAPFERRVQGLD